MRRALVLVVMALLIVGAGLAAPAEAGSPDISISAKKPGDPWSDVANVHVAAGETKTVKLKVEVSVPENGPESGAIQQVFASAPGCVGYKFKYFTKGGADITAAVQGPDGHPVTVKPNKPKRFKMTVKRPASAAASTYMVVRATDENGDDSDATVDVNHGLMNCV